MDVTAEQPDEIVTLTQTHHYGLYNQGATCYLNSVLQVLSMTTEIHHRLNPTKEKDLQLKNIFEDLKKTECRTKSITTAFGIQDVHEQRDAAECLEMILREISPEASEAFKGALTHTKKCSKGHKIIEETNEFWTLPLSLNDTHDSSYSVERSFERIFQSKSLKGRNLVFCKECEEKTEAESGCEMVVFPQVLTLLLKRFDFDYNTMTYFKSNRCVDVPRELQRNNKKYELYAMVDHFGSLTGGHYTATIRSNEDKTWDKFNDSHVYKVKEPFAETNSYNSGTVYLLMYRDAAQRLQSLNPGNGSPSHAHKRALWSCILPCLFFTAALILLICLYPGNWFPSLNERDAAEGHKIIEETNEFWTLLLSLNDTHDSSYSVERSFERIFQSKSLKGGNLVFCNDCEEKTEAESGCEVVFPQVLTLLLKRSDDYNTMTHFKSDRCVDVPRELERKNKKCELYAMVNHIGGLTGGHHTATIRSNEDNTWDKFNDSHVDKVKEQPSAETNSYNSGTVYLLMYTEAAQRLQSLNPGNGSPLATEGQKPDERREGEKREADDEEKTKIRPMVEYEEPIRTGLKTGEEGDAEKSVGETSNDINMTTGENGAELCEVKSSGHEEAQENLLRNGDGAHSSITQENTNSKLGELKQTDVDDAPVNDEEESDSRGQDLDEETEKPKQTATECEKPDERRETEKREADDEEKTKIRPMVEYEEPIRTGLKTGEEGDAEKSVGETSNDNMATGENGAELCEVKSSGHEEAQENLLRIGDGAHSSITQENTNSKLGELKQTDVDDAPINAEESDSRGQDLDEETEKPKQTATELQMCNETDTGEVEEEEEMTTS